MRSLLLGSLLTDLALGLLLILPPPPVPVAPPPRVALPAALPAALAEPDTEYKLPPNELAPDQVLVSQEAGDVADWGHATIGVADAWKVTKGKGATVAILDTGCDQSHRDLKAQLVMAKDFTGSRSGSSDVNGHGSHCAGIVLASENGVGMIGVAPEARLLVGKVLSDSGSGLSTWIAAGIDWAVENGADVISMSLGSGSPDSRIGAAVQRALDRGVIVVAAAGNEGPREGTAGWPGSFPGVVCVAAVDVNQKVANFSSRGKSVVVAAPGVNVRSCYPGDRFATMSGTSMATPYVAGCAALYVAHAKARGQKVSPAEFAKAVETTSKDLPPAGRDTASGFGLVQPAKLLPQDGTDPVIPPLPPVVGDRLEITVPPEYQGRKLLKIVLEFAPAKP